MFSDEFINDLFVGTNYGERINKSSNEKRKHLIKTLKNQLDGYWSGHTSYNIVVRAGLLIDSKYGSEKNLTSLGKEFMCGHITEEG